jgi:hypothetical protein
MIFFLGTHRPQWLGRTCVPLFVSRRTLSESKPPIATAPWALDSGGFSELSMFGRWETSAKQYVDEVRRWQEDVGRLEWAAIQDWMCEPFILAKTGETVSEHQRRTTHSYLQLKQMAPEIPWAPVLQGWHPDDYIAHKEEYERCIPMPLKTHRVVGIGSVCRRQNTKEAMEILRPLAAMGLRLHGFGFKVTGLWQGAASILWSADSLAWSRAARYEPPLPGCTHKTCANCIKFALRWREKVLAAIARGETRFQPHFDSTNPEIVYK